MSDALRNKTVGQINAILKRFTEERAAEGHYSETEEERSDVDIVDESDNEYYVDTEDEDSELEDDNEDVYDQEVVVSDGEQDDHDDDDISDLEVSEEEYV